MPSWLSKFQRIACGYLWIAQLLALGSPVSQQAGVGNRPDLPPFDFSSWIEEGCAWNAQKNASEGLLLNLRSECGPRLRSSRAYGPGYRFIYYLRAPASINGYNGLCSAFYVCFHLFSNEEAQAVSLRVQVVLTDSRFMQTSSMEGSPDRDEIDFEFVGKHMPKAIQTNFFANGQGGKEQSHPLPFDPTAGYHWYVIEYHRDKLVWLIDGNVVRTERLDGVKNRSLPSRPMYSYIVRNFVCCDENRSCFLSVILEYLGCLIC